MTDKDGKKGNDDSGSKKTGTWPEEPEIIKESDIKASDWSKKRKQK